MNRSSLVLATVLSVAAFAVQAETPDPSGQYGQSVASSQVSRTQAQAVPANQTGVNPWSISYNPLKSFRSEKTRAQVTSKVWDHIKANNLQDKTDRRMINPDAKLGQVIGNGQISMFKMTAAVSKHLS